MGLFGRKKEKAERKVISISGVQLCDLVKKAIELAKEEVEGKYYIVGPEIMFEYNGNVHFAGIKYDKKRAKKEKQLHFSDEFMTLYIDKQDFDTIEQFQTQAMLDGEFLENIMDRIIVAPEFSELL